jgi:hypothetical protein
LREILSNWQMLPLSGLALLAAGGLIYWLRPKREDPSEVERQRRAYLNKVGRIVEGQVLEIGEHRNGNGSEPKKKSLLSGNGVEAMAQGARRLLYYTYAISGVTYETAQDVTGLEERLHLNRIVAGQTASVKYDPSNPSNSILLADDWSGLH